MGGWSTMLHTNLRQGGIKSGINQQIHELWSVDYRVLKYCHQMSNFKFDAWCLSICLSVCLCLRRSLTLIAIKRSWVQFSSTALLSTVIGKSLTHTCVHHQAASFGRLQVEPRWSSEKVTARLASHWPRITDFVVCVKLHPRHKRTFVRLSVVSARGVHPMGNEARCFIEI